MKSLKLYKTIIAALLLLFVFSCSSTKKVVQTTETTKTEINDSKTVEKDSIKIVDNKTKIEKDSVFVEEKKVIIPPTKIETNIKNPCDSIGNLKNAEYNLNSGKNNVRIIFKDNEIKIASITEGVESTVRKEYREKYSKDSIFQSEMRDRFRKDSIFMSKEITTLKQRFEKKVKTRFPFWLLSILLVSIGLNVYFIKTHGIKKLLGGILKLIKF